MEVNVKKRVFKFKKDGGEVTLSDPNGALSAEEVMHFYAPQYPELTTATLIGPKVEGETAVYSVKTTVGTKA